LLLLLWPLGTHCQWTLYVPSFSIFKCRLKTNLFNVAYITWVGPVSSQHLRVTLWYGPCTYYIMLHGSRGGDGVEVPLYSVIWFVHCMTQGNYKWFMLVSFILYTGNVTLLSLLCLHTGAADNWCYIMCKSTFYFLLWCSRATLCLQTAL